jgi:hypothetical protein
MARAELQKDCPTLSTEFRIAALRRARRRVSWITAAIVVSGVVGGCSTAEYPAGKDKPSSASANDSGQSIDQARAQLKSVDGLRSTSMEVEETVSGLNKHHQVLVEATADKSAELPALIDRLAQLGWSVNQDVPDTGVYVRLQVSPQPNIGDIAKQNGWTNAVYSMSTDRLKQLVLLPEAAVRKRFGAWPGPVPSASGLSR